MGEKAAKENTGKGKHYWENKNVSVHRRKMFSKNFG
jgi:hypothetical protein